MAKVLIVDDSSLTRKILCRMIEQDGHETLQAANGNDGLHMMDTHKPDCVILDLLMPDMDGIEVLESLGDRVSEIPIVVLTSDIQDTTRQQCLDLGAVDFINKPPKEETLLKLIKDISEKGGA